jgi:colanic acid biosynthesis glycosyl transferase WcaI
MASDAPIALPSPLKVLVISHYFWPETFRVNDLVAGLVERGHRVTVLTGIPNYPSGRYFDGYGLLGNNGEEYKGAEVVRVPVVPRFRGRSWNLILNYLSSALMMSVRALGLARREWDVVFVFQPSPITTAIPARVLRAFRSTPVFLWVQDLWPETLSAVGAIQSATALRAVEKLVRWVYNGSDRILVQSEAFRASITRVAPDRADRVQYYPNFAESLYRPVEPEQLPGDPELPPGFVITFAGNIGVAQDFGTVLTAAELVKDDPEMQWIIAGDGRGRDWVEQEIRARRLEGHVRLIGQYPVDAMPRLFARSDALLATLRREPIFGLTIPSKLQSYLASGRPILAGLDGEGARIVKEAGAGLTCRAENPEDLARIALQLKNLSPQERQSMGVRGRAYFEQHFEREKLLDQLDIWLHEAAAPDQPRRRSERVAHGMLPDPATTRTDAKLCS